MIFFFSGTGNSRHVAKRLAEILDEKCEFIPEINTEKQIFADENIGFVFPVYSWGLPPIVKEFIRKLPFSFWESIRVGQRQVWCVLTCGDETGLAPEMFRDLMKELNVEVSSIWSVIMPNDYVLLPGFDVDTRELEKKKLTEAEPRIQEIAAGIFENRKTTDVVIGSFPYLKSKIIYPLFIKYGINPRKWRYTSNCIGCGKCEKACPVKNIEMIERHPKWGNNCCSCLGCFHICPCHAVEYGKATLKKGQYYYKGN